MVMDVTSLTASLTSVILSIVAIMLSMFFYVQSCKAQARAEEASSAIGESVGKIESIFNSLYSDTFSMMKEAVDDMRRHAWSSLPSSGASVAEELYRRVDEKTTALSDDLAQKLSALLEGQAKTDAHVGSLHEQVEEIANKAIQESRRLDREARRETIRSHVLHILHEAAANGRAPRADEVVRDLVPPFAYSDIIDELHQMRHEGILDWGAYRLQDSSRLQQRHGSAWDQAPASSLYGDASTRTANA